MPCNYQNYSPLWKSKIRPDILERANNCCEVCGVKNYTTGYRYKDGTFIVSEGIQQDTDYILDDNKIIKIVLTIAHLDHDINNNDYSNLKAMCQRCHLRYDIEHHKETKRNKKYINQPELF